MHHIHASRPMPLQTHVGFSRSESIYLSNLLPRLPIFIYLSNLLPHNAEESHNCAARFSFVSLPPLLSSSHRRMQSLPARCKKKEWIHSHMHVYRTNEIHKEADASLRTCINRFCTYRGNQQLERDSLSKCAGEFLFLHCRQRTIEVN